MILFMFDIPMKSDVKIFFQGFSRLFIVKIQTLFLNDKRTVHHPCVDV